MTSNTYCCEDWGGTSAWEGKPGGGRTITRYPLARAEDWLALAPISGTDGAHGVQLDAFARFARALDREVPALQTVFAPLTVAKKLAGPRLTDHIRTAPDAVLAALAVITEATAAYARAAVQAGADGIFLAQQCATRDMLTEEEFRRFGEPFDRQVLAALPPSADCSMLHLHGADTMVDIAVRYPVRMLNWHDRRTGPSIAEMSLRFEGIVVGGIDEIGTLQAGPAAAAAETADAIALAPGRRLMIGPDCVLPIATTDACIAGVADTVRAGGKSAG